MANIFHNMVTDYDNSSGDTGRGLTVFVVASMIVMQSFALWRGQAFEPMAFGGGIAAVLGALGIYLYGDNANRPGKMVSTTRTTTTEQGAQQQFGPHGAVQDVNVVSTDKPVPVDVISVQP